MHIRWSIVCVQNVAAAKPYVTDVVPGMGSTTVATDGLAGHKGQQPFSGGPGLALSLQEQALILQLCSKALVASQPIHIANAEPRPSGF